ncbi:MaoC/PaaZ C-terminal domain-containing protein [Halobacillus campisalis]|uniref:MaoC/PaaZ C-terminal domain-containing protein n=1 Tax=Halobacillus campisalis TaxID=435909 RepID=A0ABW2K6K2_9BACI|nr:MaoC/PaaZ C-terminal domain-containing protein [Halobacillus campisalis]
MNSLKGLPVGESLEEITLPPVARIDLIKYAGASGDYNPIHTIDEEAEKAGLPGVIAHGMWTMGNLAKLFTPYYEEAFMENYAIRFKGMVFIDDVITLHARLEDDSEEKMSFEVNAENQDGRAVITGTVVLKKI